MKEREEVNGTEQVSSGNIKSAKLENVEKTTIDTAETNEVQKSEIASEKSEVTEVSVEEEDVINVVENEAEGNVVPVEAKETDKEEIKISAEADAIKNEQPENQDIKEEDSTHEEDDHEEDDHEEDELVNEDFENYNKEQLVELVKKLAKHDNPLYADKYLKRVEHLFEDIKNAEIEEAKSKFVEEGGDDEGFSFNADELINRFEANSQLIHDRKSVFIKEREAHKQANLKKAEETLEKLREFVDSEESSASFSKFKEIQLEWKAIGDVPGQYSKTLWANYNALVSRFYDQRSIYFELKELDRKKNYEAKLKLCERAEQLAGFENLKEAIGSLNELHDEFKHIGPVPEDVQEDLWLRFKAASDAVYIRRKEFISDLKTELNENLAKKLDLIEKIKEFETFDSDRIKTWNAKTKEVLDIQKSWEAIGGLPREKSKEVNRAFWSSFKAFFHNKGKFFKKLDEQRSGNYEEKLKLVEKAESLKESTDWTETANEFKTLQKEWKEIGPVPEKHRNEVYQQFKAACDFFFENKRSNHKEEEKGYRENLKRKNEIIDQIEQWVDSANDHIEDLKEKSVEFAKIGFVPRKDIRKVKTGFAEAVDKFMGGLTISEDEIKALRVEIELGDILASKNSERILYGKEQQIRKQIHQMENDVALWRNNLEFFAQSKTADHLRDEVNEKIEKAEDKIASLKGQLKVLRSV